MSRDFPPVAIGGIGGSGTRVLARFFEASGYYIGGDLNEASDNLWFTLLFKRRNILLESGSRFRAIVDMFFHKMSGPWHIEDWQRQIVDVLADQPRMQHSTEWLRARADSFYLPTDRVGPNQRWAWKEPNTHVIIDRLLELNDTVRYIHVIRNGVDMALSSNQNQLQLWGPLFLNRNVEITPQDSLSYWCQAQRRIRVIQQRYNDRVMTVDFDALCADPIAWCRKVASFTGAEHDEMLFQRFAAAVVVPKTVDRFRNKGEIAFRSEDIQFVQELGYPVQ